MPITKSRSRSSISDRPGFTILELSIAMGIGAVLLALLTNVYIGANKAQATAVGGGLLTTSGQATLTAIYKELRQARRVFDRGPYADSLLARLPIRPWEPLGLSPGLADPWTDDSLVSELKLPQIREDGSFLKQLYDASNEVFIDEDNDKFASDAVGNSLLFAAIADRENEPVASEPASLTVHSQVFGDPLFRFTAYTIHFYYLARVPMRANDTPIRPGDPYTYQLMHWTSKPYADYREVRQWMRRINSGYSGPPGDKATFIGDRLTELTGGGVAGAIDIGADSAASGVYAMACAAADCQDLALTNDDLETDVLQRGAKFAMSSSYGEPMVAFNTAAVPVPNLTVPDYAASSATEPFGLEVMVAGPASSRQVLVRLGLAMRVTSSKSTLIGQSFQQVVRVYDY